MKKKVISIIMIVATVVLLIAALFLASKIFTPKKISRVATLDLWDGFYNEPENSIDAIYVGPSTIYYGLSPTDIYGEYGFTSYCISSPKQNYFFSKVYIEEAINNQPGIKVIVLDNLIFNAIDFDEQEPQYRTTIDNLNFSWNKVKAAWTISQNSENQTFLSYIFPLLRYHDRWDTLESSDFELSSDEPYYLKGFSSNAELRTKDSYIPLYEDETDEVDASYYEESVQYLKEIKEICDKNGIQLLVVRMPILDKNVYSMARHNASVELFEDMGIDFKDLNTEDEWTAMGLDEKYDFITVHHLNISGSDKVSMYLGNYLKENYDLVDHRGDSAYASWDEAVTQVKLTKMQWLSERSSGTHTYSKTKMSLASARYNKHGNLKLTWPMFSDVENVKVYEVSTSDSEPVLIKETESENSMIVTEFNKTTKFIIEYTFENIDEPIDVTVTITKPIGTADKSYGTLVFWQKLEGVKEIKLIRYDSNKKNPVVLVDGDLVYSYKDDWNKTCYYRVQYIYDDHILSYIIKCKK